ncbi:MAG: SUMF1/EgtB/PvdO family nonheme iron enzyme [Myxococcales bacterium]|nr:SUMF1/EgtB/PvdO family nonheme iron enzyme [Myxococcales bacterium]
MGRRDGQLWIVFIGHAATELVEGEGLLLTYGALAEAPLDDRHALPLKVLNHVLLDWAQAPTLLVIDACGPPDVKLGSAAIGGVEPSLHGSSAELVMFFFTGGAGPRALGNPPMWGSTRGMRGAAVSAGLGDRCVAELPGDGRPALSYWVLGALQGWGSERERGRGSKADVRVSGVLDFSAAIAVDVVDSGQPLLPKVQGVGRGGLRLARHARQRAPTLADLTGEGDGDGSPLVFAGGARIVRPKVSEGWALVSDEVGTRVELLLREAASPTLVPEVLADTWCQLRAHDPEVDELVTRECQRWRRYALRWRAFHIIIDYDHELLRRFVARKSSKQGVAAVRGFIDAYAEFPTHPRILAAEAGLRAQAAGDPRWPEIVAFGETAAIAGGRYFRGCTDRDEACEEDETPQLRSLSSYLMDRREVSRRDYDHCVFAGGCEPVDYGLCFSWTGEGFFRGAELPPEFWEPSAPQICVSYERARSYCEWLGKRLPTELEWEVAARGGDRRIYPWGDEPPTCDDANHAECGRAPKAVDSPSRSGPRGLDHMAGNVSEWVHDWYVEHYRFTGQYNPRGPLTERRLRGVRGGSFYDPPEFLRVSYRYALTPRFGYATVGFRCAARP